MEEIVSLRKKIDVIDNRILILLKERLKISKKIGTIKKSLQIPIHDQQREDEVYGRIARKSSELELNTSRIEGIYQEIIAMCTDAQQGIANPNAPTRS